jgi:hypothetical protein
MTENDKYKIKSIDTQKSKTPLRACMKDGIMPRFPFSMMISGRSGSGKTNCLINILTNEHLLKDYFHFTIVFSPTAGKYDDSYKALKLPPENFKNDFSPDDLNNLIESRKKLIEKKGIESVVKNSRVLVILDDVIANRDFLNSPEALKMFSLLRHYQVAIIVLMQSYNKLPRALRINSNATIVFPATQSEVEVLLDEITPAGLQKKQFQKVIEYCTDGRYDFLYINNHAEPNKRIRKNLDEVIDLETFKGKQ